MIVFCEECGERYVLEPEEIKGRVIMFICMVCNDIIKVPVPKAALKTTAREQGGLGN
ncbi:MAG: hypothetical protein NTV58_05050 [Deltaproteobacteria bacterium]|nr:hypothetical protein [Deltaproteobacteria bacterium]